MSFDATASGSRSDSRPPNQPRDAYVLDIAEQSAGALDSQRSGRRRSAKFVLPRLTEFPTFDRVDGKARQVPVYVYEPADGRTASGADLAARRARSRNSVRASIPWIQYMVNELGFAVIAPNVRGSSGYGKTYLALDNGMLREDAVKDVGALLVWIGLQKNFDAKHVVVRAARMAAICAWRPWSITATACAAVSMSAASPIS